MQDEKYTDIKTLQCNYWGTCVINDNVKLKEDNGKFYIG